MFDRFRTTFHLDGVNPDSAKGPLPDGRLRAISGFAEFFSEFAGASFGHGLYRVHDGESARVASALISDAFPMFVHRAAPFGYDWLGRQFACDFGRTVDGEPQILLLEPGTGEALEIPVDFQQFHESELIEEADAALAAGFFSEWAKANPLSIPFSPSECAGYRVPLFLGGADTVKNLQVTDITVYWGLCAQLLKEVGELATGTTVTDVSFDS